MSNIIYFQTTGKKQALATIMQSRHKKRKPLLHKDKNGKHRPIRYATNMDTPYEDEQNQKGEAMLAGIIFRDGSLAVDKDREANLLNFLRIHPDNTANGGNKFFERDFEKEAEEYNRVLDMEEEAILLAREIDNDQARVAHRALCKDTDRLTNSEIRRDLRIVARRNPEAFLDEVEVSPSSDISDVIARAFEEGVVQKRNKGKEIYWNTENSKKRLLLVPVEETPEEALEHHIMETKKGRETLEEIESFLSK